VALVGVDTRPMTRLDASVEQDRAAIRNVVENWVLYRDAADWDRFATLWAPNGWMTATWFQGPFTEFIEVSRAAFDKGVQILHFLGGFTCDVDSDRAIAQTKMKIEQRATVHEVVVDVTCTGRFYDFFTCREGQWRLVRRQPIYESDRLSLVDPSGSLSLLQEELVAYPVGYRHLAYLQQHLGYAVMQDLPGLRGEPVQRLYREGKLWLEGSPEPGAVGKAPAIPVP